MIITNRDNPNSAIEIDHVAEYIKSENCNSAKKFQLLFCFPTSVDGDLLHSYWHFSSEESRDLVWDRIMRMMSFTEI